MQKQAGYLICVALTGMEAVQEHDSSEELTCQHLSAELWAYETSKFALWTLFDHDIMLNSTWIAIHVVDTSVIHKCRDICTTSIPLQGACSKSDWSQVYPS